VSVCPGVRRGNGGRSGVGPALTMGCRVRWYLLSGTWFLFKLLSFAGRTVGNLVRTEKCVSTETAKRCGRRVAFRAFEISHGRPDREDNRRTPSGLAATTETRQHQLTAGNPTMGLSLRGVT